MSELSDYLTAAWLMGYKPSEELVRIAKDLERQLTEAGGRNEQGKEEGMSDQVWQPIETAPKDGTHVLVFILGQIPPQVTVAHWFDGGWWPSVCINDYETALPVSHWMPLPNTMHKDMFP